MKAYIEQSTLQVKDSIKKNESDLQERKLELKATLDEATNKLDLKI